jgi:hypothetical protein
VNSNFQFHKLHNKKEVRMYMSKVTHRRTRQSFIPSQATLSRRQFNFHSVTACPDSSDTDQPIHPEKGGRLEKVLLVCGCVAALIAVASLAFAIVGCGTFKGTRTIQGISLGDQTAKQTAQTSSN